MYIKTSVTFFSDGFQGCSLITSKTIYHINIYCSVTVTLNRSTRPVLFEIFSVLIILKFELK